MKLSGETAVEKITLDGVRGLRVTLSATVHDVLYYMSPIYCQDIIDSVRNSVPVFTDFIVSLNHPKKQSTDHFIYFLIFLHLQFLHLLST